MDLFYTPSMFWGPLRLMLFFGLVYLINLISIKKKSARRGMDYFVMRYLVVISLLTIVTMVLTQLDAYDLLVVISILVAVLLFNFLRLKKGKPILTQLENIRRRSILYIIRATENRRSWISLRNFRKTNNQISKKELDRKLLKYQMFVGAILAVIAYGSRYYFFKYDSYLLSDLWYSDLAHLKDLSLQHWFFNHGTMMGEFAIISFYSQITGITDDIALTSFGLIEAALLTLSLFWTVNKLMGNTVVSGMVAGLSFTALYVLLPLNINLITQPKSVFLALSIVLPYLVYQIYPIAQKNRPRQFIISQVVLLLGIFFIDFFVFVWIVPLGIAICSIFQINSNRSLVASTISSYLLAMVTGLGILLLASLHQDTNLSSYLYSNLFNYNSYTYTPQLILPLAQLEIIYVTASLAWLGIAVFLYSKKAKYKGLNMIASLTSAIMIISSMDLTFIDNDLMLQVVCVFIPILITGIMYSLYVTLVYLMKTDTLQLTSKIGLALVVFGIIIWQIPMDRIDSYPTKNPVYGEIINVYDRMNTELLPYSYALVHNDRNARLSDGNQYFLDYKTFIDEYPERDLVYEQHKTDEYYLKNHPDIVLPQSVMVIIYEENKVVEGENIINRIQQQKVMDLLQILEKRGRTIKPYYKTENITVYEIINIPKSTRVMDLLS